MIEEAQPIECFLKDDVYVYLTKILHKQNEIIAALNTLEKTKTGETRGTLRVDNDYIVVEFCCEQLRADFERKGFMQSATWFEDINKESVKGWYEDKRGCPYCHAPITLVEAQKQNGDVRITLNERDATTLAYVLRNQHRNMNYACNRVFFTRVCAAIKAGEMIKK